MEMGLLAAVVFVASYLIEHIMIYLVVPMLANAGALRENYRHDFIPVASGITFFMTVFLCFIIYQLSDHYGGHRYTVYLVAILSMTFLGFIDDILGQRDTLGFKGHFGKLFRERQLTTGALKALGAGALSAYIALFYSRGILEFIINFLMLGLFTNLMNLFDLRPGRCTKVFIILYLPLLFNVGIDLPIFVPIAGAVLAHFKYDLKANVMMGDSGSNVLGITLGMMALYGLGIEAKVIITIGIIGLNLYAEKYSITAAIEKYRWLKKLDTLGRSE